MAMQTVPITIVSKKFSKFVNTPEMDEKIDQLRIQKEADLKLQAEEDEKKRLFKQQLKEK